MVVPRVHGPGGVPVVTTVVTTVVTAVVPIEDHSGDCSGTH